MTRPSVVAGIRGAEKLTSILGFWPGFHDSEVLRLCMDRTGPWLEMDIHVWSTDGETDESGYFVMKNQTLATLRFDGLVLGSLRSFGVQNVLYELNIQPIESAPISREEVDQYLPEALAALRYRVTLETSFGCQGWFGCRDIEVIQVQPWERAA